MIEKIIAETIPCDQKIIKDESRLVEDLGADSLNIVEMIMQIEEDFEIEIPDEESENLHTVGQIKQYIEDNS